MWQEDEYIIAADRKSGRLSALTDVFNYVRTMRQENIITAYEQAYETALRDVIYMLTELLNE